MYVQGMVQAAAVMLEHVLSALCRKKKKNTAVYLPLPSLLTNVVWRSDSTGSDTSVTLLVCGNTSQEGEATAD